MSYNRDKNKTIRNTFQSLCKEIGEKFQYIDGYGNKVNGREKFISVYLSFFTSEVFQNMKPRLVKLLIGLLMQYHANGNHPAKDNPDIPQIEYTDFYFNWKTARRTLWGLYTDKMQSNFTKDMQELIDLGLIELVVKGKSTRSKNIYRFSSKWKF